LREIRSDLSYWYKVQLNTIWQKERQSKKKTWVKNKSL
jgi:hypothetical protein